MRSLIIMLLIVGAVSIASANVVGDIHSDNNDLTWMISVSGTWDGTNTDLLGQHTDTLPCDLRASVQFKRGRFQAGWYNGWLHAGDFVFCELERTVQGGEWWSLIRAGRCGNPARGRFFIPKPTVQVEVRCRVIPPPPPLEECTPPIIGICTPKLDLQLITGCMPVCTRPCTVGSYVIGRAGSTNEVPVAVFGWFSPVCGKVPKTCPPGSAPTPPPPG